MSLSGKLSLYLGLTALLIFVSLSAIFMRYGSEREARLAALYASFSMENFSDKVDNDFARVEECLAVSAPGALEALRHPDDIMPYMERVVKSDSLIMGGSIAVVPGALPQTADKLLMEYISRDRDGRWQPKHLGDSTYDYTAMPWFADALRAGKPMWSEPYYDKGGGDARMITYSYPLRNANGRILAVMTADVSVSGLTDEIDRLMPVEGGYAFVINGHNVFITYPDSSKALPDNVRRYAIEIKEELAAALGMEDFSKGKGKTFTIGEGDTLMMLVCRRIEATGWVVCCVVPYSAITAKLDLVTIKAVILILGGLLILLILIRFVVVYSMRPLRRLTEAVERISSGDLDTPLPQMKASDEIGRLNNAFSQMQISLREHIRRLLETITDKEHIESELRIARSIQMDLVPDSFSPFGECPALQLYALLKPAKEVGGDLYDFFFRDSKLFFTIADVSGKGVPASLFMAVTRTIFRMSAGECEAPGQIVAIVNDTIARDNDQCMFVTMFVGVLDLQSGELRFCNAGHNPPVVSDMAGPHFLQCAENLPVGVMAGFKYTEESIRLNNGQSLFLYTDGLTEAENADKQFFGDERMLELLGRYRDTSPRELICHAAEAVASFAGAVNQSDDLTMLCLRLDARPGQTDLQLNMVNSLDEVGKLPAFVRELAANFGLDDDILGRINLVLEEAIVNVIDYAYPKDKTGDIALSAVYDTARHALTFTIADSGQPFDPTAATAPDLEASAEDRPIGGLGIHLVRSFADDVEYRRVDGRNILTVTLLTDKPNDV